jgi:excisionase family DNA binding protein
MALLTLQEVAERLSVSYGRAAELARLNVIPVVRLGRQIRVDPIRLQEFIAGGGRALPGGWRRTA